jgi:glutamine synthetase
MNVRSEAIQSMGAPFPSPRDRERERLSSLFGTNVCSLQYFEQVLPKKAYQNLSLAAERKEKLDLESADLIADALKEWALKQGATHFTHWFQPLTGIAAEKHDAFLNGAGSNVHLEKLKGKELLRGEPDASSFPSGGLRATHQARGYTVWDPSSLPFLWEGGDGLTLCIPSFFFSWTGHPLDHKIPLARSDQKIHEASMRLLTLSGIQASRVFSTLGLEQEYFAIDQGLYVLRPDLLLAGRTVYGARPPKGQELEDHYFATPKDRILAFMQDFEEAAVRLGIPIKTRHNEVAPAQHEIAPLFEKASIAVDHNVLLMQLMRQIAPRHDLACLFHEKPFANFNGSGKHNNWSLGTDTGLNLLDPKENSFSFLTLLTAVLTAVHKHAGLLRASIGSAGNDHRLGGSEAPPTILSVYLGETLDRIIDDLIHEKTTAAASIRKIDLGLSHVPHHEADPSDRNRTSFFAFTGNKFEFRAVGSSAHCGFPVSVINAIVADSLNFILDEIRAEIGDQPHAPDQLLALSLPVLRKHLKASKPVLFAGNAYTSEWEREASERGLPNIRKSAASFSQLLEPASVRAFKGILTAEDLSSRYEILIEQYAKTMQIESNLMIEMFRTQILPAALRDQKHRAKSLNALADLGIGPEPHQLESLKQYASAISSAIGAVDEIEKALKQMGDFGWEAKGKVFSEIVDPKMQLARLAVDRIELLADDELWPLPKYRELLFLV